MELRAEIPAQAREWRNHPSVWKWCRQYSPISESQHRRWLDRIETDPTIKMLGIYVLGMYEPQPVGVCGLTSIDKHNQHAEFSLYIAPEYQGRGYGWQALSLLLNHAFYHHNLNRVWGETFEGNPALKMFRQLGMKEEGRQRESYYRDGRFIDSIRVSILRKEWVCSVPPSSATA